MITMFISDSRDNQYLNYPSFAPLYSNVELDKIISILVYHKNVLSAYIQFIFQDSRQLQQSIVVEFRNRSVKMRPNIRVEYRTRLKMIEFARQCPFVAKDLQLFFGDSDFQNGLRNRCVNGLSYLSIGVRYPPLRIIRGRPWARRSDRSRRKVRRRSEKMTTENASVQYR